VAVTEESAPNPVLLLDYLLDEIRATSGLLRATDLSRAARRTSWRSVALGLIRTPTEVSADLGLLYVRQNIDRARDHWREVLTHRDQLTAFLAESAVLADLSRQLAEAGILEVLPRLQQDAVPSPVREMAAHLTRVLATIRECDRLVVEARNRLMLERSPGGPRSS
jgi:hypothetical protein